MSSSSSPTADRNLLFGVLALQMNFVTRDALVAAMHAWSLDKAKPLGQILLEQGRLTPGQFQALEALLGEHVRAHGTPLDSLRSLAPDSEIRSAISDIDDPDLVTCLLGLPPAGSTSNGASGREGGRYRVLRRHAGGGLGEVFLAEDTELHREVALKEIREEYADDPARRHRFVLEAEVTGGLEHPGIVPVYGLGVYADGRPHYAMRFIRGRTFREEIDAFHAAEQPGRDPGERRLAFRALLGRFVDVCNAVAYAHSRGVLHRDLKPANVMLGRFGETLVVDWGLAKPGVEQRPEEAGATLESALRPASGSGSEPTREGAVQGTPAFMSPEQAAGRLDEMGPASDIYSLGSMLYALLTGKTPYKGSDLQEVVERARAGRFVPPRKVKADTPAPLAAVCLRAMAFLPGDRYATAELLADDVEHWLADEPVSAYPEPLPARLRRWARRHRTAVAAGAVLLGCTVVGLATSTALVWREQQKTAAEKRRAEENYALARNMGFEGIGLLEDAQVQIASVPALHARRKEVLDASARAFRRYLEQQPDDAELRERTADVYRYAANAHRFAREMEAAEPLAAEAVLLLESLTNEFAEEPRYRWKLANALRDYASIDGRRGRLSRAAESLRRAVSLGEALQAADEPPTFELPTALLDLAEAESMRGDMAGSAKIAERAVRMFRARLQLPAGKGQVYDPLLYAQALNQLAVAEREQDRIENALRSHSGAIGVLIKMQKNNWGGAVPDDVLHILAVCAVEQARTLARVEGRRKDAEKQLGQAILQSREQARRHPKSSRYREQQAVALLVRGEVRTAMKNPKAAQDDFGAARDLLEVVIRQSPDMASPRGDLGRVYLGLARLARQKKDEADAAAGFRRADEVLRRALGLSPEHARDRRSLEEVQAERTLK